ncbi:MAG TPA: MG2 domain-containing protein, partial [Acidobacteriota bacterium]|nr:MG2 domain-containing protein [Acidobacteriota bacterium]
IQKPRSVAWVTSLESGQPIAGAQVTLYPGGIKALTTSTGLTRLPLIQPVEDQPNWTLVQKGPDSVLLPEGNEYWHLETGAEPKLRWYIFDDRQYYQPGETVSLKGWVRHHSHRYGSDRLDIPAIGHNLKFTVYDNFGVKIAAGLTPLNRFGGFDVQVQLPDTAHLGRCGVVFEPLTDLKGIDPDSKQGRHSFQIQEFRRSEFEVTVSVPPGPVLFGQSPEVGVSAQYFTGQAVREAEVKTWIKSEPSHFTPPNWSEFQFGAWTIPKSKTEGPTYFQIENLFNQLDQSGQYHLKLNLDSIDPLIPGVITADAQVTDTNRITLKGNASFLVHPAALTVGLRKKQDMARTSSEATVELIVTDLDGNPQPNQEIQLTAFYCDQKWTDEQGWEVVETPVATDNIRSGAQPVVWSFPAHLSGNYRITATVADDQQRQSLSDLLTWYSGETNAAPGGFQAEKASLTLNKSSYLPGETAEILVESSFVPAEGLLTVLKKGILSTQRFTMTSPTQVLKVPVTDELVPAFAVNVDLAGAAPRQTKAGKNAATLPSQPAFATQTIEVPVSLAHRRLSVRVTPQEPVVSPGKPTAVEIEICDHAGRPVVSSDCVLAVVDEAIWSLAEVPVLDPIQIFYPTRNERLRFNNSRETVRLSPLDNGTEASSGSAPGEAEDLHWKVGYPYWSPTLMRQSKPYEPRSKPIP